MTSRHNTEFFPRPPLICSEDAWSQFDPRTWYRVCIVDCGAQSGVLVSVVPFNNFWGFEFAFPYYFDSVICLSYLFNSKHCPFIPFCQRIFPKRLEVKKWQAFTPVEETHHKYEECTCFGTLTIDAVMWQFRQSIFPTVSCVKYFAVPYAITTSMPFCCTFDYNCTPARNQSHGLRFQEPLAKHFITGRGYGTGL